MAADVEDVQRGMTVVEREDVQAVAGKLLARPVMPGEPAAGKSGSPRGRNVSWMRAGARRSRCIRRFASASRAFAPISS